MSHFSVMVVGEDIEGLMAPFQENNMGDCPEEFLEFIEEESFEEEWEKNKEEDQTKEEYALDMCYEVVDGKYGYYSNPNSFWDYYTIGGRYSKSLVLKGNEGYTDQAYKKDIDIEKMEADLFNEAINFYDFAAKTINLTLPFHTPEDILKRIIPNQIMSEAYHLYHLQGLSKQIRNLKTSNNEDRDNMFCLRFAEAQQIEDLKTGRENYANIIALKAINAYALLKEAPKNRIGETKGLIVKDSLWMSRGEMGWFGYSNNSYSEKKWREIFKREWGDIGDDELITICDCHI